MNKEIQKVADLWAEQIINGKWDNGDAVQNAFGALLRASVDKPTQPQIEKFKDALIAECIKSFVDQKCNVNLGVDYHPDPELVSACESAGISIELLPCKSAVFAEPGKVSYKFGYGTPLTTIVVSKE